MNPSVSNNLSVISKKVNVRSGNGKVLTVVREHYLRKDIPCYSQLCFEQWCQNQMKQSSSNILLPSNVTHYLLPLEDVVKTYLEILELSHIRGVIFTQTVVNAVQLKSLRHYKKILKFIRDANNSSVFFPNEFCADTVLQREDETIPELRTRMAFKAANWYYEHLGGQKPIVVVTEDEDIVRHYKSKRLEVFVLTLEDYLKKFWSNQKDVLETFYSLRDSQKQKESQVNEDYVNYFRQEILEAGIRQGRFIQGRLNVDKYARNEAFIIRQGNVEKSKNADEQTILIPGSINRNRAVHGDMVVVQLLPQVEWKSKINRLQNIKDKDEEEDDSASSWESDRKNLLPTGKVVGVLERNWREYIATIPKVEVETLTKKGGKRILVIPYDYRIPKIRILTSQSEKLINQRIVVRIDNWPTNSQYPNGHFVRSLGMIGDLETEVDGILLENSISVTPFSQGILSEMPSENWKPDEELGNRKDLRQSHMVMSIDPKGCEDVDDTLSVRKLNNGNIELGVHIADVTHFVPFNSLTDLEARKRATTVYLADRRYDMLPSVLSGNVCSLLGGVDRYAVSVLWELDPKTYKVISVWYGRTLIKSSYKLFYEAAQDIIDGDKSPEEIKEMVPELENFTGQGLKKKYNNLREILTTLTRIAQKIQDDREQGGALRLESTEVQFEFVKTNLNDIKPKEHLKIHETVAECMIMANHWVAKKISKAFPDKALLRRHPPPKKENFEELKRCASSKGWRVEIWSNRVLSDSLNQCNDPKDPMVNFLLRSLATYAMVQAVYFSTGFAHQNLWEHYGLALTHYTHFTSPIRRYADIIVHRLLLASLEQKDWFTGKDEFIKDLMGNSMLQELSLHINDRNRAAQNAQRSSQILFQTLYFKDKLPDDERCIVDAVIFSIKSNGFIAYIPRYALKGAVYLQNDEKQVLYYHKNVGPAWESGSISNNEISLTVETNRGKQTYKLFDHVTLTVQMLSTDSHPSRLIYYLLSKKPLATKSSQKVHLEKGEVNFLGEIRKELKEKEDENNAIEMMDADDLQDEDDNMDSNKKSMYKFFKEMKIEANKCLKSSSPFEEKK